MFVQALMAAVLLNITSATQELLFSNGGDTIPRALQVISTLTGPMAPSNSSTTYNTQFFAPGYNHESENYLSNEGISAMVIGFTVYAGFIINAVVMLIIDGVKRDKDY